ncbi:MAG: fibrobacter succinogenes major paralogous domain-containing protein [Bacteroidales bacterium]|nr:fibrobacter succinogenes major paralogous domain-containing protein [Bacteroidales bacterium]
MNKQARLFISILTIVGFLFFVIIGCEEDRGAPRDEDDVPDGVVVDIEGNSYETVEIGDQVWMAENLRTTRYNDSTVIPNITDHDEWDDTDKGAYARYNNDRRNVQSCGFLYNAYTIETQKLCPDGWHVPGDEEWKELEMELGMNRTNADKVGIKRGIDEGSKLAGNASLWHAGELTNESVFGASGFKGFPGGVRVKSGGFYSFGFNGCWWTSTVSSSGNVWIRKLRYNSSRVYRNNYHKGYGFSVRCLKDQAQ